MERQLALIKNNLGTHEKRLLPRFPYSSMVFKAVGQGPHVFEVKDITLTGMQLMLKGAPIMYQKKEQIQGHIHWHGDDLEISALVEWTGRDRLGARFILDQKKQKELNSFLSPANVARHLRPLHNMDLLVDLPAQLKHWVRADGPHEIFMWCYNDGEFSKVQCLVREHFWEWEDRQGIRTGRVLSKRDLDTPLMTEDEFVFLMDPTVNRDRCQIVADLVAPITPQQIPEASLDFLKRLL